MKDITMTQHFIQICLQIFQKIYDLNLKNL